MTTIVNNVLAQTNHDLIIHHVSNHIAKCISIECAHNKGQISQNKNMHHMSYVICPAVMDKSH